MDNHLPLTVFKRCLVNDTNSESTISTCHNNDSYINESSHDTNTKSIYSLVWSEIYYSSEIEANTSVLHSKQQKRRKKLENSESNETRSDKDMSIFQHTDKLLEFTSEIQESVKTALTPKPSKLNRPKRGWLETIAGCVSGSTATFIGMPFDIVKVRLQASKSSSIPGPIDQVHFANDRLIGVKEFNSRMALFPANRIDTPKSDATTITTTSTDRPKTNAFTVARLIFKEEGIRGFFAGATMPVVTRSFIVGTAFGLTNRYTDLLHAYFSPQDDVPQVWHVCAAGALTGMSLTPIIAPTEHVKVQLQIQSRDAYLKNGHAYSPRPFHGMMDCAKRIWFSGVSGYRGYGHTGFWGGVRALNTGFLFSLMRLMPGWGVYYGGYEIANRLFDDKSTMGMNDVNTWRGYARVMISGVIGGCLAWTTSLPFDVLKTRMQSQALNGAPRYRNSWQCFKGLVESGRKSGSVLKVFYRGLFPTLLRNIPVNASVFLVYEILTAALKRTFTHINDFEQ